MAFGQSRSSQANKNIDRLLEMLMQKQLIDYRSQANIGYAKEQQKGWSELEEQRTRNDKDIAWGKYLQTLSMEPKIQQLQADIFMKQHNKMDTSREEEQLKKVVYDISVASMASVKGQITPDMMKGLPYLSDATTRALLGEAGSSYRQAEHIREVDQPNIALRAGELGVSRGALGVRQKEVELKGQELPDTVKEQLKLVQDVSQFLTGEGIQSPDVTARLITGIFGGKIRDPLSSTNRGKALQWLSQMRLKLSKGTALDANEERSIASMMNTAQVEGIGGIGEAVKGAVPGIGAPGGAGLVSPRTGLTGGEEATVDRTVDERVNSALYQQFFQAFKMRGFTDQDAATHARELLSQLK